jgi:hypothetical protein
VRSRGLTARGRKLTARARDRHLTACGPDAHGREAGVCGRRMRARPAERRASRPRPHGRLRERARRRQERAQPHHDRAQPVQDRAPSDRDCARRDRDCARRNRDRAQSCRVRARAFHEMDRAFREMRGKIVENSTECAGSASAGGGPFTGGMGKRSELARARRLIVAGFDARATPCRPSPPRGGRPGHPALHRPSSVPSRSQLIHTA